MTLSEDLQGRREAVVDAWREAVIATYPENSASFLANRRDRFRNPLGQRIEECLSSIVDNVLRGEGVEKLLPALDGLVRVRAVQDFSASEAVGFVFLLKGAIRRVLAEEPSSTPGWRELVRIDEHIDKVALAAFDIHVRCKEQLLEIRENSLKRQASQLLKLARRLGDPEAPAAVESDESRQLNGGCDA